MNGVLEKMSRTLLLSALLLLSSCGMAAEDPRCAGVAGCGPMDAGWPTWELRDFQPASTGFDTTYSLSAFQGKTTVVVLLAGWCGYCQSQALELEKLQQSYDAAGTPVQIVAINGASADNDDDRAKLLYQPDAMGTPDPSTPRATFPMFQDTQAADVWGDLGGTKDDFFIYRPNGALSRFLPSSTTPLNLGDPARVEELKGYINDAL